MATVTETPTETLQAATEENALPSGRLVLLGTFLSDEGGRALIRTASGKITTVTPGTTIGNTRVIAIDDGELVITRGSRTTRLKMPKS